MADLFGKMDEKIMKRKIAEALQMMQSGKQAELAKALEKVDKKEVMEKLKTVDQKTIQNMNVNIQEIKKKITPADYEKMKNAGVSNAQIYKQTGNSIVVNVLLAIYRKLYNAMPYLFEDIRLGSFFSGIGAFEKAFIILKNEVEGDEMNETRK